MSRRIKTFLLPGLLDLVLLIMCTGTALAGTLALEDQQNPRMTPVVKAVQAVAPAVVNITTAKVVEREISPFGGLFPDEFLSPFFRDFFGSGVKQRFTRQSLGSGVIIDGPKGLVLTNAHVISGATTIRARLLDGREFTAEMVGSDPDFDLAVLRLADAHDLPQVNMGNSGGLLIGETVIAIGNPFGFSHTVTTGVISALKRSVNTKQGVFTDFIQTDAAINPGNSGGPLLNILGELIGVNTAIQADAEGIGFAIPIGKAKRVIRELLDQGFVSHVWLGLSGQNLDQSVAGYFGLNSVSGMLVTEVFKDAPAHRAGIRAGDVILEIEGNKVQDKDHYLKLLRNYTQGKALEARVFRDGAALRTRVVVEPFPKEKVAAFVWERWGFTVGREARGAALPIMKVRQNSPSMRLGLEPGDALLKIGGIRQAGVQDFVRAFMRYRMQNSLLLLVGRGNRTYYARLRI
ncbi:MAG: trypsin-like peptidase domain-containing protein [Thermodesulfobacteriota bacterium]|nr:trypsin-like peptidase domain-containing protein [Thermodesulfobacteriota bacterium]